MGVDRQQLREVTVPPFAGLMERLALPLEAEDERCSAALQEVDHWLTEGPLYKGDLEIVHDEVAFLRSMTAAPRGVPDDLPSRVDSVLRPVVTERG